jgi:hypothetical protein
MTMTALWRGIGRRWEGLIDRLWPATVEERTRAEIHRLSADLARRQQKLLRRRQCIEQLRARLEENHCPILARRVARLEAGYRLQVERLAKRRRLHRDLVSGRAKVVGVEFPASDGALS